MSLRHHSIGTTLEGVRAMPGVRGSGASAAEWVARRTALLAVLLLAGVALLVLLAKTLLLIFAGMLFAVVLHTAADFVARHTRMPYKLGVAVCVLTMIAAIAAAIIFSGSMIADEVRDFQKTLPQAIASLQATLHLPLQVPLERVLSNAEKLALGVWSAFGGSVELLSGLIVLFFLGVYAAADPEAYVRVALWFAPSSQRARARRVLGEAFGNLRRWLLGRLIAMAFVAVACGVAFTLIGLPLALPLALFAGLLTFVEYVGAVASGIPPILLAFTQGPARALEVLLFFTLLHVVEGYVLTPLLARTTVHLPPASTLATQALLATLLGPLGLTFATPLLVIAVTIAQDWRRAPA